MEVKSQKLSTGDCKMCDSEHITKDEHQRISGKRSARSPEREAKKIRLQELCSSDCEETVSKIVKDYKADLKKNNVDLKSKEDKYPWLCTEKSFVWSKYLAHIKAIGAPVQLFKDPFPNKSNGFRPGMKLEGIDPQHPSYFCVLTVAEVFGYRLRLHFDGYLENYDFWVNADSTDIFPVGWCAKNGHILHPPPAYTVDNFNWKTYLKCTTSSAAPNHLFAKTTGNTIYPTGFKMGMKLEAVNKKSTHLVCVATITDMIDNRILVHFDGLDNIYDYWAYPTSPYIHPIGWCDQHGHKLVLPSDYPRPELFTWERYLKETKSVPVPVRAFKSRPVCGFRKNMRVECVDKIVPQLIRVGRIKDVKDHHILISFDGWFDRFSYWVECDSPDIHPVGWCQKTGHPLERPLIDDDGLDIQSCLSVGCKGLGHVYKKFGKHANLELCPYLLKNTDFETLLPDRLLSPEQVPEAVVPVSRDPVEKPIKVGIKPRLCRPPKVPKLEPLPLKLQYSEEESKPPKAKLNKLFKFESLDIKKEVTVPSLDVSPAVEKQRVKHSKYLMDYVKNCVEPREWKEEDVINFLSTLPNFNEYVKSFKNHRIDGKAFIMLSQTEIVDILNIKLGPAIKLYNIILLLRQK